MAEVNTGPTGTKEEGEQCSGGGGGGISLEKRPLSSWDRDRALPDTPGSQNMPRLGRKGAAEGFGAVGPGTA